MFNPRRSRPGTLIAVLCGAALGALVPAASAADEEIRLRLAPGDYRLALPSPDGTRLAVLGGSGEPERDHVVMVLERICGGDSVRTAVLSRGARIRIAPEDVPVEYLRLAWSPDGSRLFAADAVYAVEDRDGQLTGRRLRTIPRPVFDFRFGPSGQAAGVALVEAGTRKVQPGREAFVVTLEYAMYPLDRSLVLPIPPREKVGGFWVPEDWDQVPAVQWEEDGGLLLFYPYRKVTERYRRGKARDEVKDLRPAPRAEPGEGPFRVEDPCRIEWKLIADGKSDRVRVKTT